MWQPEIERNTKETRIKINLNIDGKGKSDINTPIKFLNHMIESIAKHGCFDLNIKANGDLEVDQHHLVEDVGIVLGQAFDKALGDKKGINRAGYFVMPMDEALAICAIDISNRPYLKFDAKFKNEKIGDLNSELIYDFFKAFGSNLKSSIHIKSFESRSDHHKAESIFKAFGKSMKMACSKDPNLKGRIPSTKEVL